MPDLASAKIAGQAADNCRLAACAPRSPRLPFYGWTQGEGR
jgi:hypothetical protein